MEETYGGSMRELEMLTSTFRVESDANNKVKNKPQSSNVFPVDFRFQTTRNKQQQFFTECVFEATKQELVFKFLATNTLREFLLPVFLQERKKDQ